jgi:hypothetical protein
MNTLWNYCSVYEYVLFLEDDWRLWDQAPRNWLSVSCSILEERPEIDILFLRKYMSDHEKWQYGWTRHIPYQCFEDRLRFNYEDAMKSTEPFTYHGLTYQQIPHFMYSANPCLFKVAAYKKCNIFPMQEFNDKHSAHGTWNTSSDMSCEWGYAEALSMEKTESLYTLYLKDGVFYHNTG